MNSHIIELREERQTKDNAGTGTGTNGTYSVSLDKNVVLNAGDTVSIRSCFLDTRAESTGKLNINNTNKDVTISSCLYMTNFRSDANGFRTTSYDDSLSALEKATPDGKIYILGKRVNPPLGVNFRKVENIEYHIRGGKGWIGYGGFSRVYQYTDISGNLTTVTVTFPEKNLENNPPDPKSSNATFNGDIIFRSTGNLAVDFKQVSGPDDKKIHEPPTNTDPVAINTAPSNVDTHFVPVIQTTQFSLEVGDYEPSLLAKIITDKMVNLVEFPAGTPNSDILNARLGFTSVAESGQPNSNVVFPSKNKFLTSTQQIRNDPFFGLQNPVTLEFIANDGKSLMSIEADKSHPNYVVGASEISLEFNEEDERFFFSNLHTSQFDDNGNPTVRYFQTSSGEAFLSNSVGGVFFTDLQPKELWVDVLGFDSSVMCNPDEAVNIPSLGGGTDLNVGVPSFNGLQRGVNITSDLSGIDASVVKENFVDSNTAGDQKGADIVRYAPTIATLNTQGTATLGISNIPASQNLSQQALKNGYFLVKIEGLPTQDLVNMPSQNVQAIVSKYYSAGQFLIMENGAGSFSYTHVGEPFYLQNLRVVICDADGGTPEGLGINNTVFLEVRRADPNVIQF